MPDRNYAIPERGLFRKDVDMGGATPTFAEEIVSRDPALLRAIGSNVLTRQANATAYASGQLVGGSASTGFTNNGFTFAGFARAREASSNPMVRLDRARLYKSQATALGSFELLIFRGQPTITIADAGAVASGVPIGTAAAAARLVARFAFDMTTARVGSDGAELAVTTLSGIPAVVGLPVGATDLFGLLMATGAYTPASGEQFSVVLEGLAS